MQKQVTFLWFISREIWRSIPLTSYQTYEQPITRQLLDRSEIQSFTSSFSGILWSSSIHWPGWDVHFPSWTYGTHSACSASLWSMHSLLSWGNTLGLCIGQKQWSEAWLEYSWIQCNSITHCMDSIACWSTSRIRYLMCWTCLCFVKGSENTSLPCLVLFFEKSIDDIGCWFCCLYSSCVLFPLAYLLVISLLVNSNKAFQA